VNLINSDEWPLTEDEFSYPARSPPVTPICWWSCAPPVPASIDETLLQTWLFTPDDAGSKTTRFRKRVVLLRKLQATLISDGGRSNERPPALPFLCAACVNVHAHHVISGLFAVEQDTSRIEPLLFLLADEVLYLADNQYACRVINAALRWHGHVSVGGWTLTRRILASARSLSVGCYSVFCLQWALVAAAQAQLYDALAAASAALQADSVACALLSGSRHLALFATLLEVGDLSMAHTLISSQLVCWHLAVCPRWRNVCVWLVRLIGLENVLAATRPFAEVICSTPQQIFWESVIGLRAVPTSFAEAAVRAPLTKDAEKRRPRRNRRLQHSR